MWKDTLKNQIDLKKTNKIKNDMISKLRGSL